MSNFGRNLALWVIIALLLVVLFNLFQPGRRSSADVADGLFGLPDRGDERPRARRDHPGPHRHRQLTDNTTFQTYTPDDPTLVQKLTDKGVRVVPRPRTRAATRSSTTC